VHLLDFLHPGGDTLVAVATRQLGQAHAVGLNQAHTAFGNLLQKLPHARIAAGRLVINFNDRLRRRLEAHAYGMKAE